MDGLLCDGCLSGGKLAAHCQNCNIRLCALNKQNNSRCSDCEELPCYRITNLINMGRYLHRKEYLPNLEKIREMGVQKWAKYEEERWRCPQCGLLMSWYDAECVGCGAKRSERVFSLEQD
jgi:rubrerythrin